MSTFRECSACLTIFNAECQWVAEFPVKDSELRFVDNQLEENFGCVEPNNSLKSNRDIRCFRSIVNPFVCLDIQSRPCPYLILPFVRINQGSGMASRLTSRAK
jgi:hypothetical protein